MRPRRFVRKMQTLARTARRVVFRHKPTAKATPLQPSTKSPWKMRLVKIGAAAVLVAAMGIGIREYNKPPKRPTIYSNSKPQGIVAVIDQERSSRGEQIASLLMVMRHSYEIGVVAIQPQNKIQTTKDLNFYINKAWEKVEQERERSKNEDPEKPYKSKSYREIIRDALYDVLGDPFLVPIITEAMIKGTPVRLVEEYNPREMKSRNKLIEKSEAFVEKARNESNLERAFWLMNKGVELFNQENRLRNKKIRTNIERLARSTPGVVFLAIEPVNLTAIKGNEFVVKDPNFPNMQGVRTPFSQGLSSEKIAMQLIISNRMSHAYEQLDRARSKRTLNIQGAKELFKYESGIRSGQAKRITRDEFDVIIRESRGKSIDEQVDVLTYFLDKKPLPNFDD